MGNIDHELSCPIDDPSRQADKGEAQHLHFFHGPGFLKDQMFHCGVEVESKNHDPHEVTKTGVWPGNSSCNSHLDEW